MKSTDTLTTGEASRYCHVSNLSVLKWIKSGSLKAYRTPGGHYRILKSDFIDFLVRYNMPVNPQLLSSQGKKILIKTIDGGFAKSIKKSLKEDNYTYKFEIAKDDFDVLVKLGSFKPDMIIILTDESKEMKLMRRIKEQHRSQNLKIVVIPDGEVHFDNEEIMGEPIIDCLLPSPYTPSLLKREVRSLLGYTRRKGEREDQQKPESN